MKLTAEQLGRAGACDATVKWFRHRFGEEVEVTEETAVRYAQEFDMDWAARHVLSKSARADYERMTKGAWEEYGQATKPAWEEWRRATQPAHEVLRHALARAFVQGWQATHTTKGQP